jgi:hypothetical protein
VRQCRRRDEQCRKSNSGLYNHDPSLNGRVILVNYKTEAQFFLYLLLKDDMRREYQNTYCPRAKVDRR